MKSLHVITALNYGGAEAMLAKLLSQRHRHPLLENAIVVSLLKPGIVGERIARMGVPIETLDLRSPWHLPRATLRLAAIVRRHDPDLVQGWMYHGNVAASAAAKIARRRPLLLWNVRHSLSRPSAERMTSRAVIRLGAMLSAGPQATIYNASASRREHSAYGYSAERSFVIPNGFDCEHFEPESLDRGCRRKIERDFGIGHDVLLVAMVARQHPMKDHLSIIEAAGRARQMGQDVHLLLAGMGTDCLPAKLAAACTSWLPSDRLTLLGDRRDVSEWLPGCDIVALSSAWGEGFPNILGEAMSCGVPCVATDVGDSRTIMGAGGICVPSGEPVAMAEAIATLGRAGRAGRRLVGARGRERIRAEFSLPAIADRYARLYETLRRPQGERATVADPSQCAG